MADVDELTEMLKARRSRLWNVTDAATLAAWVFDEPKLAPRDPSPAGFPGDWRSGLGDSRSAAWAFAGWVARMTVPEAAATAGRHWILSRLDHSRGSFLRLTVGVLETLGVRESGEGVWLRVAAAPIVAAMETGAVDLSTWGEHGVDVLDDGTKTLAEEKALLSCPDIATARWLLGQPPVLAGMRMLSCWVAAGPFSFGSRYRPQVVGRAWQAAESLVEGVDDGEQAQSDAGARLITALRLASGGNAGRCCRARATG